MRDLDSRKDSLIAEPAGALTLPPSISKQNFDQSVIREKQRQIVLSSGMISTENSNINRDRLFQN